MSTTSKSLCTLLLALAPVSASPATFTSASSACGQTGNTIQGSPVPVSTSDSTSTCGGFPGVFAEAFGTTGATGIQGSVSQLTIDKLNGGSTYFGRVDFFATFHNATNTPGTTTISLVLNQQNTFGDPSGGHFAQVLVEVFLTAAKPTTVATGNNSNNANGITQVTLGGGPQTLITDPVTVPLNQPIAMYITYTVSAVGVISVLATEQLFVNGLLSFNSSGPVFVLPAGITVDDIPELYLFNNLFTPPGSAVPEPATFGLFGAGLAAAAILGRRR